MEVCYHLNLFYTLEKLTVVAGLPEVAANHEPCSRALPMLGSINFTSPLTLNNERRGEPGTVWDMSSN